MLTAKYMYPDNDYELERQRTAMFLVEGKEYGVKDVLMGQSHTTILLADVDGVFNSVHFDFFEDGKEIDIYSSPKYNPYLRED